MPQGTFCCLAHKCTTCFWDTLRQYIAIYKRLSTSDWLLLPKHSWVTQLVTIKYYSENILK